MDRFICIHGHFYQPPRESPWLEAIEIQDSAFPYHDWNERISVECYAANAVSRLWDTEGRIVQLVNNYAGISFNFGPTLLLWMEKHAKDAYEAILEGDRQSVERFSGHGSALAQAYNHIILPLANSRDKETQIIWGIKDFEYRFGRKPEGLWLPEAAVNLETLDIMAQHEIGFAVLSPGQAHRVRPIDGHEWKDVSGERIDHTMAYQVSLPSGRVMVCSFTMVTFHRLWHLKDCSTTERRSPTGCCTRSPTTGRTLASSISQQMAKAMGIIIAAATWPSLARSMILNPTGLRV